MKYKEARQLTLTVQLTCNKLNTKCCAGSRAVADIATLGELSLLQCQMSDSVLRCQMSDNVLSMPPGPDYLCKQSIPDPRVFAGYSWGDSGEEGRRGRVAVFCSNTWSSHPQHGVHAPDVRNTHHTPPVCPTDFPPNSPPHTHYHLQTFLACK